MDLMKAKETESIYYAMFLTFDMIKGIGGYFLVKISVIELKNKAKNYILCQPAVSLDYVSRSSSSRERFQEEPVSETKLCQ